RAIDIILAKGDVVDVTPIVRVETARSDGRLLLNDGYVRSKRAVVAQTALTRARDACSDINTQAVEVRGFGGVLEQATHRTGTVEGALGTSQYFDSVQAEQSCIQRDARTVGERTAGAIRHIVKIDTNSLTDIEKARRHSA